MILVIGILGKAQAGKSTISKLILDKFSSIDPDLNTCILPMAKPIKDYVQYELGYNKEGFPDEYRENCQRIGAEKRKEDVDHWVKIWMKNAHEVIKKNKNHIIICIDDIRYENEITFIKSLNPEFIFLYENGKRTSPNTKEIFRDHESEVLANLISLCYDKSYDKEETMGFLFKSYKMKDCKFINNSGTLKELNDCVSITVKDWYDQLCESIF